MHVTVCRVIRHSSGRTIIACHRSSVFMVDALVNKNSGIRIAIRAKQRRCSCKSIGSANKSICCTKLKRSVTNVSGGNGYIQSSVIERIGISGLRVFYITVSVRVQRIIKRRKTYSNVGQQVAIRLPDIFALT